MVLRTQENFELDVVDEPQLEVIGQTTETEKYVTDLLGELQMIAKIGGLESLSADIESLLSRHLST